MRFSFNAMRTRHREKVSGWRQAGARAGVLLCGAVPWGKYFCFPNNAKSQPLPFIEGMCWEAWEWPVPPSISVSVGEVREVSGHCCPHSTFNGGCFCSCLILRSSKTSDNSSWQWRRRERPGTAAPSSCIALNPAAVRRIMATNGPCKPVIHSSWKVPCQRDLVDYFCVLLQ